MKHLKLFESFEEKNFEDWLDHYYKNLKELDRLDCSNNGFGNLNGIGKLINLEWLSCKYNNLTDLKDLKNLTNLKFLECSDNILKDLIGIENLINLEKLYCTDGILENVKGMENALNIKKLHFGNNRLNSFEFRNFSIDALELGIDTTDLSRFKKLDKLIFYENKFSDRYKRYIEKYCDDNGIYRGKGHIFN